MSSETTLRDVSRPYSCFSKGKKRYIVSTAAGAGLFSSLSAQIYFPALNTLADDLNVSASLINLTVTSYMVCWRSRDFFGIERINIDHSVFARFSKALLPCSLVILQTEQAVDPRTSFALLFISPQTLVLLYKTAMPL
jgi:hypothetical protein